MIIRSREWSCTTFYTHTPRILQILKRQSGAAALPCHVNMLYERIYAFESIEERVDVKDNLYRLTLNSLTPLEHATWPAAEEKVSACQDKGQSVDDCHNYIKVLLSNGTNLFTCGTNAFSPQCSWREIESINSVSSSMSGVAMCPYSPHSNVTALLARGSGGGLFAGTPTDFHGADTAIYRTLVSPHLRTRQYDSKWLNDPQFVGSFETEEYVYFLFRESAVEYINCGKRIYSRIARVCKYDPGSPMLMKDTWTTFSKARLNCSIPGEFPFYYDEIQGAAYEPNEKLVYATFTTSSNAIAGSAICAFNMTAIASAFDGPFKHQENSGAAWEKRHVTKSGQQRCAPGVSSGSPIHLTDNQRYQLMDEAVQAHTSKPLHTAILERFTHVAVDVTPTKLYKNVAVLYVTTSEGVIKKISVLPRSMDTCVVEIWGPMPSQPLTLQYLKETRSLYVGTQSALLRIPTVQCHRHRDAASCVNAQEPYCGWDEHLMRCAPAPHQQIAGGYFVNHWQQDLTKCPSLTHPVNGGWSAWSAWHPCQHHEQSNTGTSRFARSEDENGDSCLCQTRECNNPPAQNGGSQCQGSKVRVSNCTLHGGWTAWSAWSACGATCGLAVKTRRRSCTNPAPRHGGRVCLGSDREEATCIEQPPCPTLAGSSSSSNTNSGEQQQKFGAVAPAWSPWGPWNTCSKPCGGGFKVRKRTCEGQSRKDGPIECPGCNFQVEDCNTHPCQEIKRYLVSAWQSTGNVSVSSGSLRTEKRYRFVCRAHTDDPNSVKVQAREEERHCRADGSCSRRTSPASHINVDSTSGDAAWSSSNLDYWPSASWSPCSRSCGGGTQFKMKQCESGTCDGSPLSESRACNTKPCPSLSFVGSRSTTLTEQLSSASDELQINSAIDASTMTTAEWSCWGEWSECSASCGFGVRVRVRECLGPEGSDCGPGAALERQPCEMPPCEWYRGWDAWSPWTSCDHSGMQHRKRRCLAGATTHVDCLGPSKQSRWCIDDILDNDISALPSRIELAGVSMGAVLGSCLAGFLAGLTVTALVFFYHSRRPKPRIPGSPHYISRQNPYVTVPLKEVNTRLPPKRQPSFTGSMSGTLRSAKNNTMMNSLASPKLYPKALEYETASLKRHSREAHIRAELEQEKYY
ncbi:hypothetical protein QAD02_017697 [Eretmocerus hayati]|uniref:Uncharacterized protein n=1 Tax=Eretmocerus hayati TaxID=131215 RepID=A0ACC2PEM6_9HYME|nr:hypothetical protein QAD02_017697 [Eretmocerus hayati]